MKTFLSLISVIYIASYVQAAPPSQNIVDQYVELATTVDVAQLEGSGSISCTYEYLINNYGKDLNYTSRGKNLGEAQQRLALLCIKERCNQVGQWILGSLDQMDQIADADNQEFLKSQGYSDDEIQTILKNQRQNKRDHLKNLNCNNSTPLARTVIVDSCFAQPIKCNKN